MGLELLQKEIMQILMCPVCHSKLEIQILSVSQKDAILTCKNSHSFPVIKGLPKMLVGGLEGDYSEFAARYKDAFQDGKIRLHSESRLEPETKQVQETFRDKWTSKGGMGIDNSSPYKDFMRKWMLRKYGWKDEAGFSGAFRDRKLVLDAGAGLGREVINIAKAAPNSTVVGLEFSDCAENALHNVASLSNAQVIQGDILKMPFAKESFDYILSEGVLHHTPATSEAFRKCCEVLKRGGEIAFYIYRKKGPVREFADDYLRQIVQKAPAERKWDMAKRITSLGKALSEAHAVVKISQDIPELGIKAGQIDVQRFIYYSLLKCFWNDSLPFDENTIVNFDWYAPIYAHRHTEVEIREWCRENAIKIIWFYEEDSGYSVRGTKT